MKVYKVLNINGAILGKWQLEQYLEKAAASHILIQKSEKETYPVPRMIENFDVIKETYNLLNEHLKLGIGVHPAGEWILDNFYIIEETVKSIEKDLSLKKYQNFIGLQNGYGAGFARIYVLASEIVAYTDNKIGREELESYLEAYQRKKLLSMDEIWNIGMFMQIAIIENIRQIAERIYAAQIQKYKAENIVERLVENKDKSEIIFQNYSTTKLKSNIFKDMKYPFIEYMSYILKRYGKKAYGYLQILEDEVEKTGMTVSDVINKEHFDIAVRKVSMGNSITSIKAISRINFLELFDKINGSEEILKQDPANVYVKMDYKTKEYYRNKIKEISNKTKISEIYIARKILEIARQKESGTKQSHIGYYLIDEGINELYEKLEFKQRKKLTNNQKTKIYITAIALITVLISIFLGICVNQKINNIFISIISALILIIPISEITIQIIQYILNKTVKPKRIPKIDVYNNIDEKNATMVIIPTIVKSKEKVKELMKKMEVFYLANKSENLYFTLLGDCSESEKKEEAFDNEIIEKGLEQCKILNEKYSNTKFPIFHFIYRNRVWNDGESKYLGWERKRGMINQFNEFILGNIKNPFRANTLSDENKIPKIKYIITLDSDTDLILNSAFELVGAMAHILNKPIVDEEKNVVIDGYGLIQPRVGINLQISNKNLFTKIFAGAGGIDFYSNAISDIYQDNFGEGIFTGKGIYDLETFSRILNKRFPENTVLSHDLLEGNFLRCGLASDIMLMDGYPCKYNSFMNRLSRWIRGDWQITKWLTDKSLNTLSKYKIFDNLRRSLVEVVTLIGLIFFAILSITTNIRFLGIKTILYTAILIPFLLEILNHIIFKKEGEEVQHTFIPKISGLKGVFARGVLTLGCIPYKAYISIVAIIKTIYRKTITHKKLLEWTTSEEAEKLSKTDLISYYKAMYINIIFGIFILITGINNLSIIKIIIGTLWLITPSIMCCISKEKETKKPKDLLNKQEQEYVLEIARRTWQFFKDNLNEENNYLVTDNYQEDRKDKIVKRTSSTNIGLSLLAVISAYDLKFIDIKEAINLIDKIIQTVESLAKWNGHLYNWYNTETKEPLIPRYISTVDSGNFVGYLFIVKAFFENINFENNNELASDKIKQIISQITKLIDKTDFSVLYSDKERLFSIGFNIEENKLTDSYYDLLASEARQASLIAIAKKDVPSKHWNNLSRTLTILNKYKGLISWSGTAFEYLMPNINIPKYEGSLLDESSKFLIMSQIEYSKKLGIPWGISEAAFNMKDLHSNYQYKAFGIPWLGLKRGLADEAVVSSYGSILAITESPKEVVKNLKVLENEGMYDKYGFYESIDFTPSRLEKGKQSAVVKTYMAHHQGLILSSINNLLNDNILQDRFINNPEINAVTVLLQETMPEKAIITKEEKVKPEKIKSKDYENYIERVYNKIDERLIRANVISNENYSIAINQKGLGVSKYKDICINRFKKTEDYPQGIFMYVKNIKSNRIWSSHYNEEISKPDKYTVNFMPDKSVIERIDGNIKTKFKITVASNEPVEIRRVQLTNIGNIEEILEVSSYFEPVLSKKEQDYAHQAFNNLFLVYDYDEESNSIVAKRKKRAKNEQEYYLSAKLCTKGEIIGDFEYEINKEKLIGRGNLGIPKMIKNSIPFSKKLGLVTESALAMKNIIKIKPNETIDIDLIISVNEQRDVAIKNMQKYENSEEVKRCFELAKARCEAENIYLGVKGKDIDIYQKMLGYIVFDNLLKRIYVEKVTKQQYSQSNLWKYGISGDLPIVLVKIKDANDIYVIKQMLKAYEYFKTKNIMVDLVILDEEKYSYENYVREEIESAILNSQMAYLKNIFGGIYILSKNEMDKNDLELLNFVSALNIDSHLGNIETVIDEMEEEYLESYKIYEMEKDNTIQYTEPTESVNILNNPENIKYYNEYGGFSEDGKEYLIKIDKNNKLPTVWSHILANKKFGTVLTENMGGYTWYKNSRLNRISAWNNTAVLDIPSEIIYLKDLENGQAWSLGNNPMPDNNLYNVVYGFGYAKYIHKSCGIEQELEVFIPKDDSAKVNILRLNNTTPNKRKLKIVYYIKPVLGEDEMKLSQYIDLKYDYNGNLVIAKNLYNEEFRNQVFVSSSEKIKSYTGDKKEFLGKGGLKNPAGLKRERLSNENSFGKPSCIAVELEVELESFENKEISIIFGAEEKEIEVKNLAYKYSKISNCAMELNNIKNYWNELLGRVKVDTPLESVNIMLNGWVMYQTISSRLLARSGFYQSGGAFGFRDQLQDSLATKYLNPEILKNQIIKHSEHQFEEGDVEHWWHDDTSRGIRTRFSDDLLWLPYSVIEYIKFTGDKNILDIETNYIKGATLEEGQDEKYDIYLPSELKESIYKHCIKAIDRSLNFGENGLPKIGSGDWNDGFSEVGNKGKGESIWLGFFLYNILEHFIPICREQSDLELADKYEKIKQELKKSLNTNGWDGRWFKRAYMDDGNILGSMENDECRIDSIAQSWSVISNAGDNDKKYISMESLENHLVDRENGIIKLLDPPFEKGKLEPGYIKAYLPGVRENGGQYTHAAIWAIIAEAILGFGDKAIELYKMVTPIEHARTKEAANKYKVEPFVIPADVYGSQNLAGRGGWTWYTGSSSWYYKAGIEYILGLKVEKGILKIEPCIPNDWKEYSIRYKFGNSIYHIKVTNKNGKNTEVKKVYLNDEEVENKIILDGSGKVYKIEVEI